MIAKQFLLTFALVAFLCFFFEQSPAQQLPIGKEGKLHMTRFYDNQNGLPQNTVFDIEKDDYGFLWIATEEGMVRFDGSTFQVFNRDNNPLVVSNLFYDVYRVEGEGVWAASDNSLVLFNKRAVKSIDARSVINNDIIRSISKDQFGRLWVSTSSDHLYYLENDQLLPFDGWIPASGRRIQAIEAVGDLLVIGTNKGLHHLNLKTLTSNIVKGFEAMDIETIHPDGENYYFGTKNNGLFYSEKNKITPHLLNQHTKDTYFTNLSIDEKGVLYASTNNDGLFLLDQEFVQNIDIDNVDEELILIVFNDEDNIWLGLSGGGLVHIKPASIKMLSKDIQLPKESVHPLYHHTNGDIFVGTYGAGFTHIKEEKSKVFSEKNGLASDFILSIYGRDDDLYLGTAGGLSKFQISTQKFIPIPEINNQIKGNVVTTIYRDLKNNIWILSNEGGVHILDKKNNLRSIAIPEKFSHTELNSIFEDSKGRIWISTFASGLICIANYQYQKDFQLPSAEHSNMIFSIYEDPEGSLWFGTEIGLAYFDEEKFKIVKPENGLKTKGLYALQPDDHGHLWMSSNFGLSSIPIEDLLAFKKSTDKRFLLRVKRYNQSHGMANPECNGNVFPSSIKLPNGSLWFPTIKGVAIVDPKNIIYDDQEIEIQIEGIRIGDLFLSKNQKIIIPPGTFKFDIIFTSIDFEDPENTQYYYKFINKDMEYVPIGSGRVINLTSIESGNYTVEIVGYKSGKWSKPATISFSVESFFFESNAFKLLIALFTFLAGALSIFILRKISRGIKLEKLVKERTKELEHSTSELQRALSNIEQQNLKLREITWQQSHIVRAPLTRIMGILHLLKNSDNFKHLNKSKEELLQELEDGLIEMDDIIRAIHKSSEKTEDNPNEQN
ncbi:two-component regulator propeller domain-containing protein [Belliella pelovolcani]|uniref:ligand-binding sensor domain-containing protein n=1 Tax=Belliella pelovolcani TaxID=529505 RepID=UPI00391AEE1B